MIKTILISVLMTVFLITELQSQEGWYQQDTGTNSLLMDVFFTDVLEGWAVGITNTILHTTDGGETWIPQDPPPSVNYYSLHFMDSLTGVAVGASVGGSGRIRHTTDGGENWNVIDGPNLYSLWSVYFVDENNGWIAGGRESGYMIDPIRTIHKTDNGGLNWYTQMYQYDNLPLHGIHFYDLNTGCAVGEHGTIFWTEDGGNEWIEQLSGVVDHLWGVQLLDASTTWAVGVNDLILYTLNSGINWISYPTGMTCGWADIIFPDNMNGWIVGGNAEEGKILYTPDGGGSWIEQEAGTEHSLTGVHFADNLNGWATGNIGTILHTVDGGGLVAVYANFIAEPTSGIQPLLVQFTDLSTPPDSIISWQWDFENDGIIDSYLQNPIHTYNAGGIYTVSLTVSDGTNEDTEVKEDYINVDQPIVVVELVPEPGDITIYEGDVINFSIDAYDPDGNELEYHWSVYSMAVSDSSSFDFITDENSAGEYEITLFVTDNFGTRDELNFLWNVTVIDVVGSGVTCIPAITKLYQNYPNSFNPITNIKFDIKDNETGIISIFNLKGQIIETQKYNSGKHNYSWNAKNQSSGIYFYKLETGNFVQTKKMIMMK